jgi:hypothetical protein
MSPAITGRHAHQLSEEVARDKLDGELGTIERIA